MDWDIHSLIVTGDTSGSVQVGISKRGLPLLDTGVVCMHVSNGLPVVSFSTLSLIPLTFWSFNGPGRLSSTDQGNTVGLSPLKYCQMTTHLNVVY